MASVGFTVNTGLSMWKVNTVGFEKIFLTGTMLLEPIRIITGP